MLASCVDYNVTEPTIEFAGDFRLQFVNGAPLPCCAGNQPHERIFTDSARLVINPAGSWREWTYFTRTRTNLPTDYRVQVDFGTWTYDSTARTIIFAVEGIPARLAAFVGNRLTLIYVPIASDGSRNTDPSQITDGSRGIYVYAR